MLHETYNLWETIVSVQTTVFSRRTGPAGHRQGATGARVLDLWKAAWDGLIWKAMISKAKATERELNRNTPWRKPGQISVADVFLISLALNLLFCVCLLFSLIKRESNSPQLAAQVRGGNFGCSTQLIPRSKLRGHSLVRSSQLVYCLLY
jgi:hypothetical protein